MSSLSDESLLSEFVAESKEHLASIEPDLLVLEREGGQTDPEIINRVFRAIHSIKGAAGFFGLVALKNLSHTMESVLMLIRDGKLVPTTEVMDPLLAGVDKLNVMLDDIHQSETVVYAEEIQRLEGLLGKSSESVLVQNAEGANTGIMADFLYIDELSLEAAKKHGHNIYRIQASLDNDLALKNRTPLDFLEEAMSIGMILDTALSIGDFPDLSSCLDASLSMAVLLSSVLEVDLVAQALVIPDAQIQKIPLDELFKERQEAALDKPPEAAPVPQREEVPSAPPSIPREDSSQLLMPEAKAKQTNTSAESIDTIRVRVDLLNKLMDLAGEMVLSRNQLLRSLGKEISQANGLTTIVQNIDLITSDLQEHIMQTRMQPIGSIFGKFPRIVRDMARQLGKKIELQTTGEDVELDKTILESLSDPLTHLIRNCCDHAIEYSDERIQAGKPETGTIWLKAFHEGGQINIAITDDGHGIDHNKIANKALSQGLFREADIRKMSPQEMVNLIFLPGLSTAEQVSDISGRGVGMDVVRTNIERIGGHISIDSTIGEGTTILLRLPLTLAIIPSLIVGAAGQRFAVPQVNLVELVSVRASEISSRIEKVGTASVLRLRGRLLPLVRLSDALELPRMFLDKTTGEYRPDRRLELADVRKQGASRPSSEDDASNQREHWSSDYNILVLKVGGNQFGLVVDELFDMEEIVVKPLSTFIKECKCFAGATIMGDGRVAMILDAGGILSSAKLSFAEISAEQRRREMEKMNDLDSKGSQEAVILFNVALDEYFALPLDAVLRLEQFDPEDIRYAGGREFLTHGSKSIMLVRLPHYLSIGPYPDDLKELFLIIPKAGNGTVGIVASQILDTLETAIELEEALTKQPGIRGSAVINKHLTLFLEPDELLESIGILQPGGIYEY